MVNEISDKIVLKFDGEIKQVTDEKNIFHGQYFISSITRDNFMNSSFKIADTAMKGAGYEIGDNLEYEIIIRAKDKSSTKHL